MSGNQRFALRASAELLLTVGALVVAFAVYLVFWSNVQNASAQNDLRDTFEAQVQQASATTPTGGSGKQGDPAPLLSSEGDPLAELRIPRLGANWSRVMVEGVGIDDLALGPGHFPETAMPGEIGNFAVAGHRATHGEPFAELDLMQPGDEIFVQTVDEVYTYEVDDTKLVDPGAVGVLNPVPNLPGASPDEALITLVTCHPRWGSTERLIVSGHLTGRSPVSDQTGAAASSASPRR